MNTTTRVLVGVMLAAVVAAPLLAVATDAVTDMSDKNNIHCTGDPRDWKDDGNPHEPPLEEGNPHFCPPIRP